MVSGQLPRLGLHLASPPTAPAPNPAPVPTAAVASYVATQPHLARLGPNRRGKHVRLVVGVRSGQLDDCISSPLCSPRECLVLASYRNGSALWALWGGLWGALCGPVRILFAFICIFFVVEFLVAICAVGMSGSQPVCVVVEQGEQLLQTDTRTDEQADK